jgi:hypothetical protein
MPAQGRLARESKRSYRFDLPALLLAFILTNCFPVFAGPIVNWSEPSDINHAGQSALVIEVDDGTLAADPDAMLHSSLAGDALRSQPGRILKEVGKQTIDQPGHFLIGAAPIWASRYLVGVPWYGWVVTPLLAYREWLQWPSNRWWDPPLDWAFLSLGAVVATWRRRSTHRSRDRLRSLRRRIAR